VYNQPTEERKNDSSIKHNNDIELTDCNIEDGDYIAIDIPAHEVSSLEDETSTENKKPTHR
jgi:hypothetical protein